jgi:hypothetical protein
MHSNADQFRVIHSNSELFRTKFRTIELSKNIISTKLSGKTNRKINNPEEKYDNLIIYKNVGQQTKKKNITQ